MKTYHVFRIHVTAMALLLSGVSAVLADGPQDNLVDNVRRIPKLGIEVSDADRAELEAGLMRLAEQIESLRAANQQWINRLLPDVEIFHRAVDQALRHQEFFDAKEIPVAKQLLEIGQQRAQELAKGEPGWVRQTGLVVRGYRSKIDQTVQPYGLVVPDNYEFRDRNLGANLMRTATIPSDRVLPRQPPIADAHRLDLWFHGRGETLSEVNFINQRLKDKGQFTPPGVFVLHPYGRYSNAYKFAGEVDTFEALDAVRNAYRIDPARIAVRGFSMGGAACWQYAVHYPGIWFAANPGAGFSETPEFLKSFQNETLQPTWYEEKLWRMYDCTGYAANLAFLPTIAYSGENDKQKQAADIMETALATEGLSLLHIIGPMTGHSIHPESKVEIEKTMSRWERLGPPQALQSPLPVEDGWETIDQFVTYTLRYNQSRFFTVTALEEHWEPARIVLQKSVQEGGEDEPVRIRIKTSNIAGFSLRIYPSDKIIPAAEVEIDGLNVPLIPPQTASGRSPPPTFYSQQYEFTRKGEVWEAVQPRAARQAPAQTLKKRHGLQGPIDDAFLDSFLFVKPTSTGISPEVDAWVQAEFEHAVEHWRRQFRGDARVKLDTELTRADMQDANIVLWGDPRSNETLQVLHERLPIQWDVAQKQLQVGDQMFDATTHLPLMIYPNPLAPHRYVVLNSSFTYREYDYLNNARQTPKLPDWAIVDVRTPPNSRYPGKVVAADFFDEAWQLKPPRAAAAEPAATPAPKAADSE